MMEKFQEVSKGSKDLHNKIRVQGDVI